MAISTTQAAGYSGQPTTTTTPTTSPNSTTNVISSTSVGTNPATFLYDVGLQNIYQDYQKNVSILNQAEQQSLQDAYTVREMSKKYLGEYASNVGIGDVSGNLLDIYGQYQQMVSATRSAFQGEEFKLQSEFDKARRELEAGKLASGLAPEGEPGSRGIIDYGSQFLPGTTDVNPDYIPGFNAKTYYPDDVEVGDNSRVLKVAGVEYVSVALPAGEENNSAFTFTTDDINEWYGKAFNNPNSPYYQKPAMAGAVVFFEDNQTYYYKGQDNKWYRLKGGTGVQTSNQMESTNNNFYIPSDSTSNTANVNGQLVVFSVEPIDKLNTLGGPDLDKLKVSYGGVDYTIPFASATGNRTVIDDNFSFKATDNPNMTADQKNILDEFFKKHNTARTQKERDKRDSKNLRPNSFVFYRGKFYAFTSGKIVEMRRSTPATTQG
jgi:hypothetical protein